MKKTFIIGGILFAVVAIAAWAMMNPFTPSYGGSGGYVDQSYQQPYQAQPVVHVTHHTPVFIPIWQRPYHPVVVHPVVVQQPRVYNRVVARPVYHSTYSRPVYRSSYSSPSRSFSRSSSYSSSRSSSRRR